jgi:glycosyltransferase involved in cell wall biosynthesis
MHERVTVFIPVRNGAGFIAQAIESVLGQTLRDLRLVIADNCSTDATPEIVSRYAGDGRVRLIRHQANLGMFGNFNFCLSTLETEFYMLLCCDDMLYDRSALDKAHAALQAFPQANAVYCDLMYVDERGEPIARRRFESHGLLDGRELARQSVLGMRNMYGIPLLVRSASVRGLAYDESLKYVADVDLSLASAGHGSVCRIPELLLANRYHGGNRTLRLMHQVLAQMQILADKHGIGLSGLDRAMMHVNFVRVFLLKKLFFSYLSARRALTPASLRPPRDGR